ncbi:MAG TPA: 3-oxoacyl-ACP reductase family protein [Gemmatales bacterium]|nr:3-oxoacyl-ACP reductase family protein [Gemmatales bacterium]
MRLQDKVAVVTGGARGIGKAIAQAYAAEGAKVAIVYRGSKDAADALVAEITSKGGTAKAYQCDAADRTAVNACVETILKEMNQIDILVNNAGVIKDGLFLRMEPEHWDLVVNTNLGGTYNFTKPIVESMFRARKGRIINISSVAADRFNKGQCNYSASKGAINAFTKALAVEIASRGVNVNAIAPGFIETDMSETVRNLAGDTIKNAIPMKRYGKPEDIAKVAVFLASDESAYMTGQVLTVDGGLGLGAMAG